MGTSKDFGGQENKTPLVPSWLDGETDTDANNAENGNEPQESPDDQPSQNDNQEQLPPLPPVHTDNRFRGARSNFTKYVNSGGTDNRALKKGCNNYVSSALGGSKKAAQRMKSSKIVSSNLVSLFSKIRENGLYKTFEYYDIKDFVDRPLKDALTKLIDISCLKDIDGGNLDEDIARQAAVQTLQEITKEIKNVEDFENFIKDEKQINIILEIFVAKSIKGRLVLDIGKNLISLPQKPEDLKKIETNLDYFIRNQVEKALNSIIGNQSIINNDQIQKTIDSIYQRSYKFLEEVGE
ncbi:MAG: hypothetical protein A2287_10555 [Candidatus Melainabacteria bacterium RIFOXYA12_FULL_32_12]|nr:MAG: hypothetical protein A2287_10555 [Candidatus Melainabacteria bacterium RIFOXYA12_FULL_32_12]